jgi:hypothetical protein
MTKETKDVFQTNVYRKSTEPKAAEFGVGASDLKEIEQATEARRELSREQSTRRGEPKA